METDNIVPFRPSQREGSPTPVPRGGLGGQAQMSEDLEALHALRNLPFSKWCLLLSTTILLSVNARTELAAPSVFETNQE